MSGCLWRKNVPNLISSCMNLMLSLKQALVDDERLTLL